MVRQVVERAGLYPLAAWGLRQARRLRKGRAEPLVAHFTVVPSTAAPSPGAPRQAGPPNAPEEILYTAPAHKPSHDLVWLETCFNVQSEQFMIDCLPMIDKLLADYPAEKPIRVLDVGTGSGAGANLLARLYAGTFLGHSMIVDTIELAHSLERYAKAKFPAINYMVGDVLDLRPEHPWDLVVCSHTIEHIKDYSNFIQHLQTLAKKWVLLYAPWKEQNRIHCHVVTIDEPFLREVGAVEVEIINSPGWRPAGKDPRCVLFTVRGTAGDAASDHSGPAMRAACGA